MIDSIHRVDAETNLTMLIAMKVLNEDVAGESNSLSPSVHHETEFKGIIKLRTPRTTKKWTGHKNS